MASVSEDLKRERELRGISLEQIAEETRIGLRFLQAIDSGELEVIPGDFYRRSYVRAYASYLGMDPDRVASAYDFQASRAIIARPRARTRNVADGEAARKRSGVWWFLVLGVLAAGGTAAVWSGGGASRLGETPSVTVPPRFGVSPKPHKASARTRPLAGEIATPVVERDEPMPAQDESHTLEMRLMVEEPCWLEVRADGEVVSQGLMLEGFEKQIRAREEIRLWLGNAGGISYWINGKRGKSLGQAGQVRKEIRITPENMGEYHVS